MASSIAGEALVHPHYTRVLFPCLVRPFWLLVHFSFSFPPAPLRWDREDGLSRKEPEGKSTRKTASSPWTGECHWVWGNIGPRNILTYLSLFQFEPYFVWTEFLSLLVQPKWGGFFPSRSPSGMFCAHGRLQGHEVIEVKEMDPGSEWWVTVAPVWQLQPLRQEDRKVSVGQEVLNEC
jgi:hypothetical protein